MLLAGNDLDENDEKEEKEWEMVVQHPHGNGHPIANKKHQHPVIAKSRIA